MPLSQVSTPTENAAGALPLKPPTEAFDPQTLNKFQDMLIYDPEAQVLSPNRRSYLKMILEDGYEVPHRDQLGQNKPKTE